MRKWLYYLSLFVFVITLSVGFSLDVKAEEVDYSSNYYYSNINDITYSTGFRSGTTNNITLYGKEQYAPTYDNYEYLTGIDNLVNYKITNGNTYTVKVTWNANSVGVFTDANFNVRLNGLAIVHAVNGNISYQKTTYTKSNCFTYSSDNYCTYNFITTYTFTATVDANSFRVGTYNNSAMSLYGVGNYLTQSVQVTSVDVMINADDTIINQNEQIIDQNQTVITQNDEAEKTRKGILATIKDLPNKLLDMFKGLFIPDEDELQELIDNFKDTMSTKLGALYQVGDLIVSVFDSILDPPNKDSCITFPEIKDPMFNKLLISETDYCFDTLREDFGFLFTLSDMIISIVCTLAFANMLYRKFEAFIGGVNSDY